MLKGSFVASSLGRKALLTMPASRSVREPYQQIERQREGGKEGGREGGRDR